MHQFFLKEIKNTKLQNFKIISIICILENKLELILLNTSYMRKPLKSVVKSPKSLNCINLKN